MDITKEYKNIIGRSWKVSKYGVISGPYYPVFRLNTEIYSLNLRIQSEYRKIRTRNNSVFGHFSRSVNFGISSFHYLTFLRKEKKMAILFHIHGYPFHKNSCQLLQFGCKQRNCFQKEISIWPFSVVTSHNGETHFKTCAAFAARLLKSVWPSKDILH